MDFINISSRGSHRSRNNICCTYEDLTGRPVTATYHINVVKDLYMVKEDKRIKAWQIVSTVKMSVVLKKKTYATVWDCRKRVYIGSHTIWVLCTKWIGFNFALEIGGKYIFHHSLGVRPGFIITIKKQKKSEQGSTRIHYISHKTTIIWIYYSAIQSLKKAAARRRVLLQYDNAPFHMSCVSKATIRKHKVTEFVSYSIIQIMSLRIF